MESTFYDALTPDVSSSAGQESLSQIKRGLIETLSSMDAYQLLGLLVAILAGLTTVGFVGAGVSEASSGYGSGGGELVLAIFWMLLAIGGISMMSGQLNFEGVRELVEQNHAMIIALLVAFILGATLVEVLAIKTLMS